MSQYFINLPTTYYKYDYITNSAGNQIEKVHEKLVTDITLRTRLNKTVKSKLLSYYKYNVGFNQRPDSIAHEYYGDVKYTWLVFLANNIFDPIFDWPMFGDQFDSYVASKYGSITEAQNSVHHYEEIIQSFQPATDTTPRIEQRSIEVDELRFQGLQILSPDKAKTVTNYQYEYDYNEKKKNIVLIEDIYAEELQQNLRELLKNV